MAQLVAGETIEVGVVGIEFGTKARGDLDSRRMDRRHTPGLGRRAACPNWYRQV